MNNNDSINKLINTISQLRDPLKGCPWDKEQTHSSLKKYLLEEVYEVLTAIDKNSNSSLKEELGDLLFQICLHAQIAKENNNFDFYDIAEYLNNKMIERHPHVFGESNQNINLSQQWEEIKERENKRKGESNNPFANIPDELPSLARAVKILKKLDKLNIDSPLTKSLKEINQINTEQELAEILLGICNRAKSLKIDPEDIFRVYIKNIESSVQKMHVK